jgi:drug/metabolite transporter (DMT)-like permease
MGNPSTGTQAGAARGVIAVLVAGVLWGTIGMFVRIFDEMHYSVMTIIFVRMSIAFVITAIVLLVSGRKHLLKFKLKDLWCLIATGVASGILLNWFLSVSAIINTLSLAHVLLGTCPIFVVLLAAPIFGEKVTSIKVQCIVIVIIGAILTSGMFESGTFFTSKGFVLGLLSGFGYGVYSIMTRYTLNRGYETLTVNVYGFLFAAAVCIPWTDFSAIGSTVAAAPGRTILILLAHSLCGAVVPYILYVYGMKYMDTGKASILVSIEPVAGTILGITVYHEIPTVLIVVGIVLVLFGIILLNVEGGLKGLVSRAAGSSKAGGGDKERLTE